ncbi:peroxidase 57-like [Chenopodium quinoa]|uniref:Peroxidase n=1 Tax=Chenopodium quinoa TaxID=63459 RepID=A0A803KVE7_CHEQI|nr:peroxidase 57-like [Chenopodium quinoa]
MKFSVTSVVVRALVLTMLILAISHVGQSQDSNWNQGRSKSSYGRKDYGNGKPPRNSPSPIPSSPPLTPPVVPPSAPTPTTPSGLQVGFYKGLCPNGLENIEEVLLIKVQEEFQKDTSILPALLRMQFHDCFVHGCDASILINGLSTEKTAGPNLSVRGYEVIDTLKDIAEAQCPGVVSCADIIAIATKEVLRLGGGPNYPVQTGRRDGLVSRAQDVNLPSPFLTVSETISAFGDKNFTPEEMVILLGCHTVGVSNCAFFQDRLYEGTSRFDPLMDPDLRQQLMPTCPKGTTSNNSTFLDQNPQSSNIVDNSFFDQILEQRGILPIDQALARDPKTTLFVQQFAQSASLFNSKLASAMVKMQALDVLTGSQGEIRKTCSSFN